jgi:arginase
LRSQPDLEHHAAGRRIAILGAPSSIGIRPYDETNEPRRLDLAPGVLRELGLVALLAADDLGDVEPPPYRDRVRPVRGIRNEEGVAAYSRALADRVAPALEGDRFVVVLGGDCSIVLGSLHGARRRAGGIGLVYVDGHADFATPEESSTGSAASMCLALAIGRGDSPLAQLGGDAPLVHGRDVVLIGRRDEGDAFDQDAIAVAGILDMPDSMLSATGAAVVTAAALERVGRAGFWIHVDADVLDPRVMPAVDSPEPGGPDIDGLVSILAPMVAHPSALGMDLTIYDPLLDPERGAGSELVALLERILAPIV